MTLIVPRTRDGKFSTELFERYQRNEKALLATMLEMYVQGVSTRKVSKVIENMCGKTYFKFFVSSPTKELDEEVKLWRNSDLSSSESEYSWSNFFEYLKSRGLSGLKMVILDSHKGLVKAI